MFLVDRYFASFLPAPLLFLFADTHAPFYAAAYSRDLFDPAFDQCYHSAGSGRWATFLVLGSTTAGYHHYSGGR